MRVLAAEPSQIDFKLDDWEATVNASAYLPKTAWSIHALRWDKEGMVSGFGKNLLESPFSKDG
jgi:hypothetical protein